MAFCAICGSHHDPDMPCGSGAEQVLRDSGINKSRRSSKKKSQKTARDVERQLRVIKIVFVIVFALIVVYMNIIDGTGDFDGVSGLSRR